MIVYKEKPELNIEQVPRFSGKKWLYKGHLCSVDFDVEPDVVKAWHEVTLPSGEKKIAAISPYDTHVRSVELWIDLGYPGRIKSMHGSANWVFEDLEWAAQHPIKWRLKSMWVNIKRRWVGQRY